MPLSIGLGLGIPHLPNNAVGGGGDTPTVTILLQDDFTTNAAAPLTSPRTCEPGPGVLTLVQTDGQFSISAGKLQVPAQATPVQGDLGFYEPTPIARAIGLTLLSKFTLTAAGVGGDLGGLLKTNTNLNGTVAGGSRQAVHHGATNFDIATGVVASFSMGIAFTLGVEYTTAVVIRSSGAWFFIKGGIFTQWTLLYVSVSGNDGTLYAQLTNFNSVGNVNTFRLGLLSAFSGDYSIATYRIAGVVANNQTFVHEANCIIEYVVDVRGVAVRFRIQDASNYWYVWVSSTGGLELWEVTTVGGATQRAAAAAVVSVGHRVVIICDSASIKAISNSIVRWTYTSATNFQSETDGLVSDDGQGGSVSDLVTSPRNLSGDAADSLDELANS